MPSGDCSLSDRPARSGSLDLTRGVPRPPHGRRFARTGAGRLSRSMPGMVPTDARTEPARASSRGRFRELRRSPEKLEGDGGPHPPVRAAGVSSDRGEFPSSPARCRRGATGERRESGVYRRRSASPLPGNGSSPLVRHIPSVNGRSLTAVGRQARSAPLPWQTGNLLDVLTSVALGSSTRPVHATEVAAPVGAVGDAARHPSWVGSPRNTCSGIGQRRLPCPRGVSCSLTSRPSRAGAFPVANSSPASLDSRSGSIPPCLLPRLSARRATRGVAPTRRCSLSPVGYIGTTVRCDPRSVGVRC